jgi:hypothetical protein
MPDATLLLLLDEVRAKTLRRLDGVTPEEARWTPAGLHNTILWHAGHIYVVVESLAMRGMGRPPCIPDDWFAIFSWESRPAEVVPERWPALETVVTELQAQHRRLRALIHDLTPEQLEMPVPELSGRPTRYAIVHGLHDEANHAGEIWLLRKIWAASS